MCPKNHRESWDFDLLYFLTSIYFFKSEKTRLNQGETAIFSEYVFEKAKQNFRDSESIKKRS